KAVERNTAKSLEIIQEKLERILREKLAPLQNHVGTVRRAVPSPEVHNRILNSSIQNVSQEVQALQGSLESLRASIHDLQHSREEMAELESKLGKAVEKNTEKSLENFQKKMETILNEKLAILQRPVEAANNTAPAPDKEPNTFTPVLLNMSQEAQARQRSSESMQASMQHDGQHLASQPQGKIFKEEKAVQGSSSKSDTAELQSKLEFAQMHRYSEGNGLTFAVDVTLDADTAHPRLKVSQDGKSVKDTGKITTMPRTEKRFDSHLFVLAKEGYTSGKRYWEVDVGEKKNWEVGIAREPVTCKGTLTLSPEKGFWVIGLVDGRDYWARTVPWTRLAVSGKLARIGIFLDPTAKKLSFFNVQKETAMYTFSLGRDKSQEGKFFPFFSTGSISAKPDTEPLKIVQRFDE
ncbi:PREDICTED: E3 ubiquitin-protein ligase TRIM39, partial [Tinamus guttatus]|uniref:E3 ubiquitin-protein ligase TRIM39 n=1 Tax=Tinamus guttatus TaxID=94827 RepID=UPI00052F3424